MTFDINYRSRKILYAVVSEYLATGEAVGSRTITRRHSIDLSAATVRNVMADLEEMGLLEQPHTSAGRVPTDTGLRFFIDSLLKVRSLSPKEKDDIRERYGEGLDLDELFQRTSRVLSDITHYAGIVLVPNPARQKLRHIEFVPLSGGRFLCILVTHEGRIENKLVHVDFPVARGQLERIHNYLNQLLEGLTLEEVRERVLAEMGEAKNSYDEMVSSALRLSQAALERAEPSAAVIVSGQAGRTGRAGADALPAPGARGEGAHGETPRPDPGQRPDPGVSRRRDRARAARRQRGGGHAVRPGRAAGRCHRGHRPHADELRQGDVDSRLHRRSRVRDDLVQVIRYSFSRP